MVGFVLPSGVAPGWQLTLAEREVICRGITAHQSARSMAKLLGRSPSTISREMSRNGGYDRYRATLADENAWARAGRPKYCKLATNPRLRRAVAAKLRLDWSPEQIAGWLKRTHPEDGCNQVSHETIYRSLFVQTRGVLKKELLSHLRSKLPLGPFLWAHPQFKNSVVRSFTGQSNAAAPPLCLFDLWWEWAEKPVDSPLTIDAEIQAPQLARMQPFS